MNLQQVHDGNPFRGLGHKFPFSQSIITERKRILEEKMKMITATFSPLEAEMYRKYGSDRRSWPSG